MGMTNALNLLCGLALFLYGMHVMGEGLTRASGGKLESILESLTKSKIKAVLLGAGVTAIIQSSSATTVMVVGFVNSGIMRLSQAAGVIMGANIGTTVTSWILSLTGLQGDSLLLTLCKPATFTPVLAFIGVCLLLFAKGDKKHDAGSIMIGFAVLMTGMEMMSGAVKPLANVPEFTNILLMFTNPILGVIAGAVLTAIIQSSSASVGILQALCVTGAVKYSAALPIIMGQNIGTCVTALISSIGASKNAKRAALIHLYFNIIGTILFMAVFYAIDAVFPFAFMNDAANAAGIAVMLLVSRLNYQAWRFLAFWVLGGAVLLLIAVVGVYADFQVNGKATIITIVAVIAVLGAFVLPELTARRFIKKDKSFIGHTMRYVFNDNGINVLDEQNGTTALHAWGNIMNMYETAGYFFMFLGKQSALLIPKRCLSDEDLADFREMLQFQLGSRYENRTQKSKKAK